MGNLVSRGVKLPGYTLIEALVMMVVMGILIILGFALFNTCQKAYVDFMKKSTYQTEFIQFYTDIKERVFLSSGAEYYEGGILLNPASPADYQEVFVPTSNGEVQYIRNSNKLTYKVSGHFELKDHRIIFFNQENEISFIIPFASYELE